MSSFSANAASTASFNGFQLIDTTDDAEDTLEHLYLDSEHQIVLKKTEHGSSTASSISKTFKNGVEGETKYKVSFDIKGKGMPRDIWFTFCFGTKREPN